MQACVNKQKLIKILNHGQKTSIKKSIFVD